MKRNSNRTSIIILSHNHLHQTTQPCLESIFQHTGDADFEVIVVDNGSTDGTTDYLERMKNEHSNLRCLYNGYNAGFAAGNNIGIRAARGTSLVLLNNDTIVTRGWLKKLIAPLMQDETIGLIGPVTNSVGNEQRIYTAGKNIQKILDQGEEWCQASKDHFFTTDLLGFFCVAMKKELLDGIGYLDESFGVGFYEDEDFCYRVKTNGLRLICREDVFIYHQGSATFGWSSNNNIKQLVKANRKRLEQKIGKRYPSVHCRDKIIGLLHTDLVTAEKTGSSPNLLYRMYNRLKMVETLRPNNPLKRILFNQKVAEIKMRLKKSRRVNREKRKCVIIAGMHRSGTSAMSAVLKDIGLFNNGILCESPDNPKGFFEWQKGVSINEQILKAVKSSWDDENPLAPDTFNRNRIKKYKNKISRAIREDFPDQNYFVIKDPRISLLIPLYTESLTELGIEPLFIIMERNEEEIYLSLHKRNKFSRQKSQALCKKYKNSIRQYVSYYQNATIQFNDLVQSPVETVQGVVNSLKLPCDINEKKSVILDSVDPGLKHHYA